MQIGQMQAFRATLEELQDAALLVHVADASHPELDGQVAAVAQILEQLSLHETPALLVLNKADALHEDTLAELAARHPDALFVSARCGAGLAALSAAIAARIDWRREEPPLP
jgi:GTP-binding protein HflX